MSELLEKMQVSVRLSEKKMVVILHKTTHTHVESDSFILDNEILIGLQIFLISPTDHKGKHHGEGLWKN